MVTSRSLRGGNDFVASRDFERQSDGGFRHGRERARFEGLKPCEPQATTRTSCAIELSALRYEVLPDQFGPEAQFKSENFEFAGDQKSRSGTNRIFVSGNIIINRADVDAFALLLTEKNKLTHGIYQPFLYISSMHSIKNIYEETKGSFDNNIRR
ncbi:hypothetical protein IEQ34_007045 [Dendrobium chrysotoxum]|uniref:Uncharacterized protein n=1 Tax=Dendrobium chrysotoxum TaxID=161865 RepID=A0AAV7H843_DENCH|nr:hypothetical protein IEQ34_007045 [Dendrobium chrysotoxum]